MGAPEVVAPSVLLTKGTGAAGINAREGGTMSERTIGLTPKKYQSGETDVTG
jgi:hypothetical protein